jgi:hypothetical protein
MERGERIPLSFAQQRLWFLAQMEGVSQGYRLRTGWRLSGDLAVVALARALDRIVVRHEALRTTFVQIEGEPVQRIGAIAESGFLLREDDLRQRPDAEEELGRVIAEEAVAGFDLEAGPLIRGRLVRLEASEYALLITMHHIVSDGWSMEVMLRELSTLYGAFVRGEADPLPELKVQYADYAIWQRQWMKGEILGRQAEYWKGALSGAPELLELPGDHVRPAQQDYRGALAGLVLERELTERLKEVGKRHGTTLFMTLLAGWGLLLSRLSGQREVVIGTPVANRGRGEIEGLIGFFVNTLALRLDLGGGASVGGMLEQVKRQAVAAQQHQDIPFEQVVELMHPVRSLSHSPLLQVMFAWQSASQGGLSLAGLTVKPLQAAPHVVAKFDLTLFLQETGDTIIGDVVYARALFEAGRIERYLGHYRTLLEAMVGADAGAAVDGLQWLTPLERRQVLYEWNETGAEYPRGQCVQELFEEQVERTPEAAAVVFGEGVLSYGELNRQANRLAH